MQIAICKSGSGTDLLHQPIIRLTVPVEEGAKRVRRLREQNHILLPLTLADPVSFETGDWIAYRGERFYLTALPAPSLDTETGAYRYALEFHGEEFLWANKLHKLNPDSLPELSFRLTSSLAAHARVILSALAHNRLRHYAEPASLSFTEQRLQPLATTALPYSFEIDDSIATAAEEGKLIEYANVSILEALDLIAEAWECEWWRDGAVIRFGHCETGDDLLPLERDVNISEIRPSGATDAVPNRLYPYGGTENIPPYYRKNLRLLVTASNAETGRFLVDPAALAFDMFNPDRILRRRGYNACFIPVAAQDPFTVMPDHGIDVTVFSQTEEYKLWEGSGYDPATAGQRLEAGTFALRLPDFKPNIRFERTRWSGGKQVTDIIAPDDTVLDFLCQVSFRNGGILKTEKAESHVTSFKTSYPANPAWGNLIFTLTEKSAVKISITVRWRLRSDAIPPEPNDRYSLRLNFDCENPLLEGTEPFELWERVPRGAVSIDCEDNPAIGPLRLRRLSDGQLFPVIYNPGHNPLTAAGLPFELTEDPEESPFPAATAQESPFPAATAEESPSDPSGEQHSAEGGSPKFPALGDLLTFADPAADLNRLRIPASWYLPEDENAVVDAITAARLRLPANDAAGDPRPPYIDAYEGITDATAVEHAENFDTVFPSQSWAVSAAASRLVTANETDGGQTRHTLWFVTLAESAQDGSQKPFAYDADFRLTEDLRLKFTSGLLNGMTFSVGWHPEGPAENLAWENAPAEPGSVSALQGALPCFEIGVTTDYGPELPNAILRPQPGDTAILLGWADDRVYDDLIAKAENDLLARATDWLERRLTDGQTFDCPWLPVPPRSAAEGSAAPAEPGSVSALQGALPPVGRRVALIAPDLFPRGRFNTRVLGYEHPLDIPEDHPVITVGDILPKSRLAGIETALRDSNPSFTDQRLQPLQTAKTLSGKILVADLTNQTDAIVFDPLGRIVGPLPQTQVRAYADGLEVPAQISIDWEASGSALSWEAATDATGERHSAEGGSPKSAAAGLTFAITGQTLAVTGADLSMPDLVEIPVRVRIPGYLDIDLQPFDRTLAFTLRRQRGEARLQLLLSPTAIHRGAEDFQAARLEEDGETGSVSALQGAAQPPVTAAALLVSASEARVLTDDELAQAGLAIEWASSDQPEFGPYIPPINEAVGTAPATDSLTARLVRYPSVPLRSRAEVSAATEDREGSGFPAATAEPGSVSALQGAASDPDEIEILDIETLPVLRDGKDGADGQSPYLVEAYTLTGDKIKNGQGATELRARVSRDGQILEDAASLLFDYTWEKYDNSGNRVNWKSTGTPTRTGNPLTVSASEVDLRATFNLTVTPKPQ